MLNNILNMLNDEEGASLVEYGLIIALVAVVAIGGLTTFGTNISTFFTAQAARF